MHPHGLMLWIPWGVGIGAIALALFLFVVVALDLLGSYLDGDLTRSAQPQAPDFAYGSDALLRAGSDDRRTFIGHEDPRALADVLPFHGKGEQ
jgi:hypothetical protein